MLRFRAGCGKISRTVVAMIMALDILGGIEGFSFLVAVLKGKVE